MKLRQLVELLGLWSGEGSGGGRSRLHPTVTAWWRWILSRFAVAQISFHSLSAAVSPRRVNRR